MHDAQTYGRWVCRQAALVSDRSDCNRSGLRLAEGRLRAKFQNFQAVHSFFLHVRDSAHVAMILDPTKAGHNPTRSFDPRLGTRTLPGSVRNSTQRLCSSTGEQERRMGITQAQNMNDSDTEMKNAPTKATADDKATTADDKATTENSSGDKPGSKIDNAAEIDNSGSHARIDDPVEPPARYAPKLRPEAGRPSIGETADLPPEVLEAGSKSILSRLFDPDRKQKPQLWTHIKLVAPGPADQPPPGHIKWRSKHAVAAYCLKCKKQFTYTRGTSKTIR